MYIFFINRKPVFPSVNFLTNAINPCNSARVQMYDVRNLSRVPNFEC